MAFHAASDADVLVTGSSGHLGAGLMLSLPALGFKPVGLDIIPSSTTDVVGSINDRELLASLLEGSAIKHVIHTATLHKPHVESHTKEDFVKTNISGTLALLEETAKAGSRIESFVFISTTSTFGTALRPAPGQPAAWIDEDVVPIPKNVYGVTKVAAEEMCHLVHAQTRLPVLILRTSRFFPEEDDDEDRRRALGDENLKVMEMTYRRCDLEDVISAAVCAMKKARELQFGRFIISAPPVFANEPATLAALDRDPAAALNELVPGLAAVFEKKGWKCLDRIDRVYDSGKAVRELGWRPKYTFAAVIGMIEQGREWRSDIALKVGRRGYHSVSHGVYTKK